MKIFLLLLAMGPGVAWGCRDGAPKPALKTAHADADAVFAGEVMGKRGTTIAVKIRRQWKGEPFSWVSVEVSQNTCDPMAEAVSPGSHWIIFARREKGKLTSAYAYGSERENTRTVRELDGLTPPTSITFATTCDEKEKATNETMARQAGPCESSKDCVVVRYDCPFGCGVALSKKGDGDLIARLIADYEEHCQACKYQCASERSIAPRCVDKRCVW